jgi:thiopeptide-type bacteriocin biosynthesis protein
MAAKQPAYRPLSHFVLRTPALPFDVLERWSAQPDLGARRAALRAVLDDPAVREAVFVASPELAQQIPLWEREPDSTAALAIERALVRYVSRMASRCTPFGLFASVAVAPHGTHTRLDVPPRSAAWRRTRLDNDVLFAWTAALGRDRAVRDRVRYRRNSSLYAAAAKLRYAEARVAGALRRYQLVAVDPTDYLDALLARATGEGATRAELLAVLTADPEISAEEAAGFLDEVIDSQLIVPVIGPHVTGPEPMVGLAELLRDRELADHAAVLDDARRAIAAIDGAAPGVSAEPYRAVEADLRRRLPVAIEAARLFQVDLYRPAADASLGPAVTAELLKGAELLHQLTPNGGDEWSGFRNRFVARYETREVPLLEVLDDETGIGFGGGLEANARAAPLIAGLALPAASPPQYAAVRERERYLIGLVARAADDRAMELELSRADVDQLSERAPIHLADVISINATLMAASPDALHAGDYQVRLGGVGMGAQLLGRFAHGSAAARALVEQIARTEEAFHPDAVFAEIVHLPEGRLGNILLRPVLRDYEIPYLGTSGAPIERQIEVSDLMVSVVGDRVVLRSQRLGREVRPRMTTAHNFAGPRSLAPYRFLCAHAMQGISHASWQWGVLEQLPFLPRVRHGRFVLARARWLLQDHELAPLHAAYAGLAGASTPAQHAAIRGRAAAVIAQLRARLRLPRWVVLTDGDNELAIDLDNELMVDSAAHLLKGRKTAVLHELWPAPGALCATGPEGRFSHELVVFAARSPEVRAAAPRPAPGPIVRRFLPGSAWLYLRIYTGSTTADPVLRGYLAPVIAAAREDGLARRWFFIRYGDPDWHLRVRFSGDAARLTGELLPRLHRALAAASDAGQVWQVALGTYEREVERYGGPDAIELAEALFHHDSECALGMIERLEGDAGAAAMWRLALRSIDRLLDDLGLSLADKLGFATRARDGYGKELGMDVAMQRSLGDKFRTHAREIAALLAASDHAPDHAHAASIAQIAARSVASRPHIAQLRALEAAGRLNQPVTELAHSFVHMAVNRMMRSHQRVQELVLCDLLRRHYASVLARARQRPT